MPSDTRAIAAVDGSYNHQNGRAGYGVVFDYNGLRIERNGYVIIANNELKSVVGELQAALVAARMALEVGCSDLIIMYDFEGIRQYATDELKPKNGFLAYYAAEMGSFMESINISFWHAKTHSGKENHNRADKLAKLGCGIK